MITEALAQRWQAGQPIYLDLSDFAAACSAMAILSFRDGLAATAFGRELTDELSKQLGLEPSISGERGDDWQIIEVEGIYLQLMSQTARDHYQLESIWRKASKLQISPGQLSTDQH